MSRADEISDEELRDRVLYALLGPAARIALAFGVPLADVRERAEMAYYHETKRRGLKMKEVATLMNVSMSKVALLSRGLKANFVSQAAELPRRIEFMLWAQPLTLAKMKQVLTDATAAEVNTAVRELLENGRIEKFREDQKTLYRLTIATDRRVWDNWLARIDGLNNALGNVADAVYARFFTAGEASFARTLSFRIRREDLPLLRRFYEEQLFPLVSELDANTTDDDDHVAIDLSLFWAPHDLLRIDRSEEDDDE